MKLWKHKIYEMCVGQVVRDDGCQLTPTIEWLNSLRELEEENENGEAKDCSVLVV